MERIKRVAAINDISCIGKCSLTVALPIISAGGIECSVIPTAVLSTHTGGFENFTFKDLTDEILPIVKHWKSLNIKFDSIYSGYLGSIAQVDIIDKTIDELSDSDTLVLVDPVMADFGELYKNFDKSFPEKMKKICKKADVITPNITEACLLTNTTYENGPYTKEFVENLIEKLTLVCDKKIVLTGVYFDEDKLGVATYDNETDKINYCFTEKHEGVYHGTGDIFACVLLTALLNGKNLETAAEIAQNITSQAIKITKEEKTDVRYGVRFEAVLPKMIELLKWKV